MVQAIEDAFTDGMDIVSCSLGTIALTDPSQDFVAAAFDKAAVSGMVVVVAAGNDGGNGQIFPTPTYNTISSPATAPHVIAVGATLNSHVFQPSVSVQGGAANLQSISALTSDGYDYGPFYPVYAPLVDITQIGGDAFACNSLPSNSLYGDFALVEVNPTGTRGGCTLNTASTNLANAGAVGIVFYLSTGAAIYSPIIEDNSGNLPIAGPVVMVANSDGVNLKNYVDAHAGANVTIDPNGTEQTVTAYSTSEGYTPPLAANQLASYSSSGPAPGGMGLKPDIVATGGFDGNIAAFANSGMYLATQSYDPAGELYSPSGYTSADGTSFAAPLVAGAAALVKQAHPNFTAAQIRSALINTASQDTSVDDQGYARTQVSFGAGRLDAGAAVGAAVTVSPSSISFGSLAGSLPAATAVTIANGGASAAALTIAVGAPVAAAGTPVTGISVKSDQTTLTVPAGGTATFNISLSGAVPASGQYTGNITVTGTGVALHMPYLFVVPSGVAYDMFAIIYSQIYSLYDYACFEGPPSTDLGPDQRLQIKVVDSNGAPVANSPVKFTVSPRNQVALSSATGNPACTPASSGGTVTCPTDANGVATAEVTTGTVIGATPYVDASVPGFDYQFGYCNAVIAPPTVSGIADSAVGATTVAPGSFISIYGANLVNPAALYDTTLGDSAGYVPFPIGVDGVSVSFDIPGAYDGTPADYNGAPGHLVFVAASLGQINLQVPWELQGASSVQVKVNVDSVANSNIITVPLAQYAPTLFQASGIVAAVNATTGTIITASNPAKAGDVVELYGNGLGPVNNQPASGDPSPTTPPFSTTKTAPTILIGGQNASVSYSGLAPGVRGCIRST